MTMVMVPGPGPARPSHGRWDVRATVRWRPGRDARVMPIRTRPARSLLALALIANLVVVGACPARPWAASRSPRRSAARPRVADARTSSVQASVEGALSEPRLQRARIARAMRPPGGRPCHRSRHAGGHPRCMGHPSGPGPSRAQGQVGLDGRGRLDGSAGSGGSRGPSSYKGRNHVWIPALGINRSVSFFSCSSSAYPGNRVYRWGCAGTNNVYLFGHAHSVFKPLHDAYVRGRLRRA